MSIFDTIKNTVSEQAGSLLNDLNFEQLLNNDFIKKYTSFASFNDLLSKFSPEQLNPAQLIDSDSFNTFIKNNSIFQSFSEMIEKAKAEK